MIKELTSAEQAIQHTLDQFTQAWHIHDAHAFARVFAEDADFTNVFGQQFHGRPAIEAQHIPIFATMFRASRITSMEKTVRLISGDLAAVDVIWTMTGAVDPKGNPWPDRKGLMNLVMREENGSWLILVMHNMDLPVAPLN